MSMVAASSGEPEAKKFRFALPTQVVVNDFNNFDKQIKEEIENQDGGTDTASICDNSSDNGLDLSSGEKHSPIKSEEQSPSPQSSTTFPVPTSGLPLTGSPFEFPWALLIQQVQQAQNANSMSKEELKAAILAQSRGPPATVTTTPITPIPGAIAVAASPAAQLFTEGDWSWHRNPAAAIRSGGTNKQTPVWKYFVYNKAENLSRCIIGDCTYVLKGPHTSTLACHLKKHPIEYAEFQKLKLKFQQEYTRERSAGQLNSNGMPRMSQSSSAESSAGPTPVPGNQTPTTITSCGGGGGRSSSGMPKTPKNEPVGNGIFMGTAPYKSSTPTKGLPKPSSITDILNLLNARAQANAPSSPGKCDPSASGLPAIVETPPTPTQTNALLNFNAANMIVGNPFLASLFKQSEFFGDEGEAFKGPALLDSMMMNNGNKMMLKNANPAAALQAAALAANAANLNANLTQKKWQRQDRKQRELEIKLSLALSTTHIPTTLIKNSFFRDFMESAQPKFTMPEVNQLEELINLQYARTIQTVKLQLGATSKYSLIVDVLNTDFRRPENSNPDEGVIRLCISAAYYSPSTQSMEVVLLGIRAVPCDDNLTHNVHNVVNQLVNEYNLDWDCISRIVSSGLLELGFDKTSFPRFLEPYNRKLTHALINIFDADKMIIDLKRDFYTMIYRIIERPEVLAAINKFAGHTVIFPVTEPFLVLGEAVLKVKESILLACCQQPLDNPVPMLKETQWTQLDHAVGLLSLFCAHMNVVQDENHATIDRVVPSLMQLKVSLERDFLALGDLPRRLLDDILSRTNYILDKSCTDFDGTYIQATALNPQLALMLDDKQLEFAKASLEKVLTDRMRQLEDVNRRNGNPKMNNNSGGLDAILATVTERKSSNVSSSAAASPPLSSASSTTSEISNAMPSTASALYPDLVHAANQRRKQLSDRSQLNKNPYSEAVVQAYFDEILNQPESTTSLLSGDANGNIPTFSMPPLHYWQFNSIKCSQLSDLAIELLTIPSCTVSLERIFNFEGSFQHPVTFDSYLRKLCDSPERMERDAILRFNRAFIPKSV